MTPTCDVLVELPWGGSVRTRVYAPNGVRDEPGTPFAVAYRPAPVVMAGAPHVEDVVRAIAGSGRSAIVMTSGEVEEREGRRLEKAGSHEDPAAREALEPRNVLQAMSRLGVTQAHVAGALARAVADEAPARVLSVATVDPVAPNGSATAANILAAADAAEPARCRRPLVTFDASAPRVLETPAGILVRQAERGDEPAIQAMYDHLLDACDEPGRETCGWRRGFWPLPDDVSRRLREGTTWVAVEAGRPGVGVPVLGAMSLDSDFGLPGVSVDWDELGEGEALTCHLLASDPAARGRGVATSLLAAYAREGVRRGCRALRINTSPQSLSNRLYHELGFTLHRPVWFPYDGLDLTGWTNVYEIRLDVPAVRESAPVRPVTPAAVGRPVGHAS